MYLKIKNIEILGKKSLTFDETNSSLPLYRTLRDNAMKFCFFIELFLKGSIRFFSSYHYKKNKVFSIYYICKTYK